MKAVVITSPGEPGVLQIQEVENPRIGDDEVLIKVEATALNRADTLQRKGSYPPPKGASQYPGLECSGTVESVGKDVSRWNIGDQLFALLSGGGYVEKVAVPAGQVLPVPPAAGLRTRSLENKAAIVSEVEKNVWPAIAAGKVKPVVDKSFPLAEAAEAHMLMESSKHIGTESLYSTVLSSICASWIQGTVVSHTLMLWASP